jgi:N-acetylneuraminic acid mutarotase
MVIFGGKDEENNKLNDIWAFNFSSYTWTELDNTQRPFPRSGHSATLFDHYMLIFGGIIEVTKELDDLVLYDFKQRKWIQLFEELMLSPIKQKYGNIISSQ